MILGGPEWHSKISPIIYDGEKLSEVLSGIFIINQQNYYNLMIHIPWHWQLIGWSRILFRDLSKLMIRIIGIEGLMADRFMLSNEYSQN